MFNILGVHITDSPKEKLLAELDEALSGDKARYLVTPNPEIILTAQRDEELFMALNNADYSIPDGVGLVFAAWAMLRNLKRITGSDLCLDVLALAEKKNLKTAIIAWENGLSSREQIQNSVLEKYPSLNLRVIMMPRIDRPNARILDELSSFGAELVFVGLGFPYQEKFSYWLTQDLDTLKLALGIGGSFDFISGQVKRSPRFIRAFGFEWLWRLLTKPKKGRRISRKKRIFEAVIIFPWEFIVWRFIKPFFYRPNVACFIYQKINGKIKVLVVRRNVEEEHWQLPQGGTNGESIMTAGHREATEELGTEKIEDVAVFRNIHRYRFPRDIRFSKSHRDSGYRGQKQGLFVGRSTGNDDEIHLEYYNHLDWRWVALDELAEIVHSDRKEATEKFVEKFETIDENRL